MGGRERKARAHTHTHKSKIQHVQAAVAKRSERVRVHIFKEEDEYLSRTPLKLLPIAGFHGGPDVFLQQPEMREGLLKATSLRKPNG